MLLEMIDDGSVILYVLPQQDMGIDPLQPMQYLTSVAEVGNNLVGENPLYRDDALS